MFRNKGFIQFLFITENMERLELDAITTTTIIILKNPPIGTVLLIQITIVTLVGKRGDHFLGRTKSKHIVNKRNE